MLIEKEKDKPKAIIVYEDFSIPKNEVDEWLIEDGQTLRENAFLYRGKNHYPIEAENMGGKIVISPDKKSFTLQNEERKRKKV